MSAELATKARQGAGEVDHVEIQGAGGLFALPLLEALLSLYTYIMLLYIGYNNYRYIK